LLCGSVRGSGRYIKSTFREEGKRRGGNLVVLIDMFIFLTWCISFVYRSIQNWHDALFVSMSWDFSTHDEIWYHYLQYVRAIDLLV
jgi:hypothetical protein